jgi:predicted component of type VI protein secretion system
VGLFDKLSGSMEERTIASITRNLAVSLNAKKGYGGVVDVHGLGAYDQHLATKPLVKALLAEMLEVIRACEPRLQAPALRVLGRDRELWVRLELTGTVDGAPHRFSIRFHSMFRTVEVEAVR